MKFWKTIIITSVILLTNLCNHVEAKSKYTKQPLIHTETIYGKEHLITVLNRIIQDMDPKATIGINVRSMKYGDTLYTKNNHQLFIPASIIKILTAEAALLYLGPEYKFPTTLLTDAKQSNNGVINGNVFLVQSGDPTLTYDDMTDLMVTLKSQQVHRILGNVYLDTSAYDDDNIGPGWSEQDTQYCYAAPISATIINRNCLSFKLAPAKTTGVKANIVPSPHAFHGILQNNVITKEKNSKSCYVHVNTTNNAVSLNGCMTKNKGFAGISTVIPDVISYNKSLLKNLFTVHGIHIAGSIEAGEAQRHLSTIAVHYSKPLYVLINEMLKKSDNIIAGSLLKKMGEFESRQPGSWNNGSEAVKKILSRKAAVDASGMTIIDGSGLSKFNRVKPAQVMQVLDFAYHHYGTNYELISSLPISGRDGTLKNRLRNVVRKVRAKTGTMSMSGVVSLAGYVVTKEKEPLAFVIIVNGQGGNGWKYREIEDRIVTALANYSR